MARPLQAERPSGAVAGRAEGTCAGGRPPAPLSASRVRLSPPTSPPGERPGELAAQVFPRRLPRLFLLARLLESPRKLRLFSQVTPCGSGLTGGSRPSPRSPPLRHPPPLPKARPTRAPRARPLFSPGGIRPIRSPCTAPECADSAQDRTVGAAGPPAAPPPPPRYQVILLRFVYFHLIAAAQTGQRLGPFPPRLTEQACTRGSWTPLQPPFNLTDCSCISFARCLCVCL